MDKRWGKDSWHWNPSLSVGISAIDEDHKRLFQLFNEARLAAEVEENNSPLLQGMAQELVLYAESHFKREGAIMMASGYPSCEQHQDAHHGFMDNIQSMLNKAIKDDGSIAEFVYLLKELFLVHIKESDQNMGQYVQGFEKDIEDVVLKLEPLALPKGINIYIVDDEELQVELMTELLDVAGFTASGFTSGLVFIKQPISSFDIILLDLNMPEIDGIEVMRILYNRGCTPAFILISGFDERVLHSAKQFAEAKKIEVLGAYTKPINTGHFIREIAEIHARKKLAFDKRQYSQKGLKADANLSLLELRVALNEHQFVLFYQPQVDIQSGEVKGFEALVRLEHPIKGLVFPDQFISLAEASELMPELTHEIFSLVVEDYKKFQQRGIQQKISINVSAQDLDLEMPERIASLLVESNIPAEALMIELTESALRTSISDSLDILNRLRMKGFSLSIDDFGTGYSSLVQLYQAPFTELKIDLRFVMRMLKDKEAYAIVKICILLAKELKLVTVAEGVETQEILDELAVLGCDIAQGYHIAKPLPLDECCEWFKQHQQQLAP